jgi:bifunctional DNA-binding transcriptional regulator/antitoxin component of YhaV-PrlF toxin-antitoxin module
VPPLYCSMQLLDTIKAKLGLQSDERTTELSYLPSGKRDEFRPKFRLTKEVNADGQIYLPKDVRTFENRSDIEPGDNFSLDIFAASYGDAVTSSEQRQAREQYVDASVISGHRITIPAEVRKELDIREGDTIAVHGYINLGE